MAWDCPQCLKEGQVKQKPIGFAGKRGGVIRKWFAFKKRGGGE